MPRVLSPAALLLICWGLSAAMAGMVFAWPASFDLVPIFMRREGQSLDLITGLGLFWLVVAAVSFLTGDVAAQTLTRRRPRFRPGLDLDRAARMTFAVNATCIGVTVLWIVLTADKLGGLTNLVLMSLADSVSARDHLLENKLFTGMRLFYAALPATGCLAAALLACGPGRRARRLCRMTLVVNTLALAILPLVMSQRLLLLQFLLSSYLVTCLLRRRIVGLPWLMLAATLFLTVWMLREAVTNPHFHRPFLDIGTQKLAFYFVNDLLNAVRPIEADFAHSLGAVSLRGLMFLTFSDGMIESLLARRLQVLSELRGGGEFPLLTAPFVDFGSVGGAVFLLLVGFLCRILFYKAATRTVWAVIYAQIGAGLLFSSHAMYLTHQNMLFGLIVVACIARACRPPRLRPRAPDLPDSLWRAVVPFRTRRRSPVPEAARTPSGIGELV